MLAEVRLGSGRVETTAATRNCRASLRHNQSPDRSTQAISEATRGKVFIKKFRGSIPHPMQLLCTLRDRCRQRPRNTRYQAGATPYSGRTSTGWIAPALSWRTYSITSSAMTSSVGGTTRPSALAVVRFKTTSNLVGCSTGISLGLAPRKILSANSAARRYRSGRFGP
jgi:hypothetical protein